VSVGNINLATDVDAIIPTPVRNWTAYKVGPYVHLEFDLNPLTMRPFVEINNKSWKELFYESQEIQNEKFISMYSLFHRYVRENVIFPTQSQFIIWLKGIHERSLNKIDTLPTHIVEFVQSVFEKFERAGAFQLPVKEFIKLGYY
jgi:hypothetical protein